MIVAVFERCTTVPALHKNTHPKHRIQKISSVFFGIATRKKRTIVGRTQHPRLLKMLQSTNPAFGGCHAAACPCAKQLVDVGVKDQRKATGPAPLPNQRRPNQYSIAETDLLFAQRMRNATAAAGADSLDFLLLFDQAKRRERKKTKKLSVNSNE